MNLYGYFQDYFFNRHARSKKIKIASLFCLSIFFVNPLAFAGDKTNSDDSAKDIPRIAKDSNLPIDTLAYVWKKTFAPPAISGYVQADYGHFDHENVELGDRAVIRRAYFQVSGDTYLDWAYMFSIDDINGTIKLENNYVAYKGWKPAILKIGQFKEYFSLEELTSSTNITFIERALPVTALAPSYHIGIGLQTYGDFSNPNYSYTAAGGLFGQPAGWVPYDEDHADQGGALTGRVTYAYYPDPRRLFLLGLAGSIRVPDSDDHLKYSSSPESYTSGVTFVNTSQIMEDDEFEEADGIEDAHYIGLYGFETAAIMGPFSFQGEYIGSYVHQDDDDSLNFKGWYAFATWFLTGESRAFDKKTALFTSITPLHPYGAWEVGLRFSYVNLNDEDIHGGSEHNTTLGLSWYANPAVRFMANYTKVHASQTGEDNSPNIYTLRAQVSFG